MSKQRVLYLDVIRVLACLMVITMHAPKPDAGTNPLILSSISLLMAPCIGLFFMVSGALLLPVSLPMKEFYRKRMGKVLVPTLVWTFIYLSIRWLKEGVKIESLLKTFFSIPFSAQGHGVLWFMYTLIGLYLIAPILSSWLRNASRREVEFILILWSITLLYPILKTCLYINETPTGILYSFSGYTGYFLLGYYLHHYQPRISYIGLILLFIIPVSAAICVKVFGIEVDFYSVFWYLSIFVVMMAVSIFASIQRLSKYFCFKSNSERALILASNMTFGIYLSHILFMREIIWPMPFLSSCGSVCQILLITTVTYCFSSLFCRLIARFPHGEIIIGYRN